MATSRIFIKGLPPNITEAEFRKHFSAKNREITDVKLIPQRRIGYVGYKSQDDATSAVKYFNRSYIRMSKLSVESARPISDTASPKEQNAPRHTSAVSNGQSADQDMKPKKRKREEQASSDPKLREFLQVMKTGREGVIADEINPAARICHASEAGQLAVPENESDNEYEQVPMRKEKLRKIHTEQSKSEVVDIKSPAKKERTEDDDTPVNAVDGEVNQVDLNMTDHAPPATTASDNDWLRSRTNRLLDLVDPDDLAPGTMSGQEQDMKVDGQTLHSTDVAMPDIAADEATTCQEMAGQDVVQIISRTSRLFVRNLSYSTTEDDLREAFIRFGDLQEVHLPLTASGSTKGFALVQFVDPSDAVKAFQALDGTTFQGRIIHIIPANPKPEQGLDEFGISKLPLKKQNMIRKKAETASNSFNWNSLYMNQNAVNESVAKRLGVSKSELLDPTSSDAAIKQAIAETSVIQETKAYFAANGVDLNAFKSTKRGDDIILVKNFPHGTSMEEIRKMFEEYGQVLKVLMPPTGTIAIVQFAQSNQAKVAFGKLAYRRIRDSVLFLEKGPKNLLREDVSSAAGTGRVVDRQQQVNGVQKFSVSDLLSSGDKAEEVDTTSLFIRNLNFTTTTGRVAEAFRALDGFVSARVKTKTDPKKPGQTLSMGFGFVEFQTKEQAHAALKVMDGYVLDGHTLGVKASHRGHDAAEERRREDRTKKAAAQRTKIVIKNLPFQATKKDVRSLLGTYGQLRSVRVPQKADFTSRGFAFADFVTAREAENALNALKDTHLLGRRLVLDFAEAEAVDAEEEIEKMQRKVGGQVNKVALQQLTGGGRRKVNIGNDGEELDA